ESDACDSVTVPCEGENPSASRCTPQLHGSVLAARGNDRPVRTECDAVHITSVSLKSVQAPAGASIPQLDCPVKTARGNAPAIGAERDTGNQGFMPPERKQFPAAGQV